MRYLLKEKNVDELLQRYLKELNLLYDDLKELQKNRKYTYLESCSIRSAYSYLDYVISVMQTFAMSDSGLPDKLFDKVIDIKNKANEISNFITINFSDVWEKDYSILEKCV